MEPIQFDRPPDSAAELVALLDASEITYQRESNRFRFLFTSRGCRWETLCDCEDCAVLIYGRYPFPLGDRAAALELCNVVNSSVVHGSLFLAADEAVFRTSADIQDTYTAPDILACALEYNAAVMVEFWNKFQLGGAFLRSDAGDRMGQ